MKLYLMPEGTYTTEYLQELAEEKNLDLVLLSREHPRFSPLRRAFGPKRYIRAPGLLDDERAVRISAIMSIELNERTFGRNGFILLVPEGTGPVAVTALCRDLCESDHDVRSLSDWLSEPKELSSANLSKVRRGILHIYGVKPFAAFLIAFKPAPEISERCCIADCPRSADVGVSFSSMNPLERPTGDSPEAEWSTPRLYCSFHTPTLVPLPSPVPED